VYVGQLGERHAFASRCMHQNVANGGGVDAGFRNVARGDVELALPLELHAHGFAPDGHIDQVLHVFDIDGVARQGLAIDVDAKLRLVRLLLDAGVGRSRIPRKTLRL